MQDKTAYSVCKKNKTHPSIFMYEEGSLQLVSLAAKSKKYLSFQKKSLNCSALVSQSIQRCSDAENVKFRLDSPMQYYYHNLLQVLDHCQDVLIFISASHFRMNCFILSFKEMKYSSLNIQHPHLDVERAL